MRLILTTIILTMLAQPVWAAELSDLKDVRSLIATTENEGVARALGYCLPDADRILEKADEEFLINPACSCALKHSGTRTAAGFKVLFDDCVGPNFDSSTENLAGVLQKLLKPSIGKNAAIETAPDLTLNFVKDLQSHVAKCWQPPIITVYDNSLAVDILVEVDKAGEVQRAEVRDKERYNSDPQFKAASLAAQRAVVDCSPLPIPSGSHEQLKEFIINFDPTFMSR